MKEAGPDWHQVFEGSGSATGNGWVEEVCYLGDEQWLLAIYDDPAWSGPDATQQDSQPYSSADLARWAVDMDSDSSGNRRPRSRALLKIAIAQGAAECVAVLQSLLARPTKVKSPAETKMAKGWAAYSQIRAEGKRLSAAKQDEPEPKVEHAAASDPAATVSASSPRGRSLIERLPEEIARLEAKHGPNDPYVKDLKEQLRASIATQGQTAQDVSRAQRVRFEVTQASAKLPLPPKREDFQTDEEFEEAQGYWRGRVGRIQAMVDRQKRSKDSQG